MADSSDVKAILARGRISADDVLKLRHRVFWKGSVTREDAEMVFALNERLGERADASWADFFVEAVVDYLVFQTEPKGYMSDENGQWLIERISRDGRVETATELALLVKTLERAKASPAPLTMFALDQVKWGVLKGEGQVGRGRTLEPGVVGEAEVELLRRILYAAGGDGNVAITQAEAELLFDINDATSEAENCPAWSDLFVKAIANFLMAYSGYQVPSRAEALRREAWLDSPSPGVGGFMSQMLAGGLAAVWDAYKQSDAADAAARSAQRERGVAEAARLTEIEARWVAERIGRDGLIHENELALLNFLKGKHASLPPKLQALMQKAAA
jgi:hypothetical protein